LAHHARALGERESHPRQGIIRWWSRLKQVHALAAKGENKSLIALKGGCNLRFYFGSMRYSEDIDFDVVVVARDTLKNKVDRLLQSPLVLSPLKTRGVAVAEVSAPKQTETTQRWKIGLVVRGLELPIRTKIEFSRRSSIRGAAFEGVSRDVTQPHGLTQVLAMHYTALAAVTQKIHALAARAEPQARDVFDLDLLFARPESAQLALTEAQKRWLPAAIEHAMSISNDEFRSKVVAYLDPEQVAPYETRAAWDAMQVSVVGRLEALR
jgi:predicted nucleotidyltransferase component of viral defense system